MSGVPFSSGLGMTRKYYLDWLRVLAFALLILFHVGMLYVMWPYNLKSPRLVPGLEWAMLALSPWRLPLLFVISGVASRVLIEKYGAGGFALNRLRRLLPPILMGMFVIIPPQTWIELVAKGVTHAGYLHFWLFSYLPADQTLVRPLHKTMPTWDHLWFLVYLFFYALGFALLWKLAPHRRDTKSTQLSPTLLVMVPALVLCTANVLVEHWTPRTDALVNDWREHLKWIALFATGVVIAGRDNVWPWLRDHRGTLAALAALLLALIFADHWLWMTGTFAHPWDWISWGIASGAYGWLMVLAVIGYGVRYLNRPSATLSYLNEAILPVYVLHQPILLLAAFVVFPWRLPLFLEGATLIAITALGSLAIYHALIRPFGVTRFLFGVKPKRSRPILTTATVEAT
jgi:hypothetical protein